MVGKPLSGPGNVRKSAEGVKKNGWVFDKPVFDKPEKAGIKGRHNGINKRTF
jgi:hypothetical protein